MPSAVAALPLPIQSPDFASLVDSSANAAANSIVGADFAALLFSQLSGGIEADQLLPPTEPLAGVTPEILTTPTDPALLLASMGIAVPPAMASRLAEGVQLESDTGLVTPQGSGEVVALSTEIGGKAGASSEQTPTDLFSRITQAATVPTTNNLPALETPAKLAGFEQKLAESTQVLAEPATATVQPGNATQLGMNASPARTASSEQMHIETPLKNQAWPAEFGQKIVWMTTQDKQSAQITLNPPQLGPIEISLNVKNDQATAVFVSANAEVRAVIESAMPRLREMLEGAGVQLGQTNVSAESFRQSSDGSGQGGNRAGNGRGDGSGNAGQESAGKITGTAIKRGNGLVDTFA
jgi:flagellar hook-length control protein FliK